MLYHIFKIRNDVACQTELLYTLYIADVHANAYVTHTNFQSRHMAVCAFAHSDYFKIFTLSLNHLIYEKLTRTN